MTDDLNLHVEAIRALFKKRFSGGIEGFPGQYSPDIFKGKDDINVNEIDWNDEIIGIHYVDEFSDDTTHYIKENNLNIETIEKIIEIFKQKTKNFDERIWDRLEIILNEWDERILEDQMTDEKKLDEIVKLFVQTLKTLKDENKSLTTTINDWELTWNAVNSEGEIYDFRYDIENGYTRISAKNNKTDEVKNLHYNLETEKLEVKE